MWTVIFDGEIDNKREIEKEKKRWGGEDERRMKELGKNLQWRNR